MTRTKAAKSDPELGPGATDALTSFEATLERLHQIVERLEGGDLDLEESLRLFEEGVRLSRASQARLNSAEKRVEELLAVDANGQPIVRELDVTP
jgi:exodeoxyribonuclease VII small subunit